VILRNQAGLSKCYDSATEMSNNRARGGVGSITNMKGKDKLSGYDKYLELAESLNMINAKMISPTDIFFDIRAILKCRWGCEDFFQNSIRCGTRNTTYQERVEMVKSYKDILLVHSNDARELSVAVLEIERTAFLDGYYFACAIRTCNLCKVCTSQLGKPCPTPEKVRPCDQSFGIDVYKTARNLGLPCEVLQSKQDVQNRYGFVLID
jgi:predicted metal-binding protein